jgi:hypothetical protein
MKYARIVDSIVQEVFTPPPGFALEECFTAELVTQFIPCSEEVQGGWILQQNGAFVAPPDPIPSPEE